ncbi:hypothetical protein ACFW0H_24365 [Pseudomonas sp. CR3202]|uniref:hypothetical protein n=1 Tax=Pseudomonas sp. CR3202 TaxID=3351532 RepID=UPI003BF26F03
MYYRSIFLAVLSLTLSGCAVYDYDDYGYRGYPRYYDDDDYRVYRHYDRTPSTYYIVDHRRHDDFHNDKFRDDDFRGDRRFDPHRQDFKMHKHRFDRRFDDNNFRFHHDRRFQAPRFDDYQERRHDYTPRLRTWGRNDMDMRQQYRVQPGYEARPHHPRHNNRSSWSMGNRR